MDLSAVRKILATVLRQKATECGAVCRTIRSHDYRTASLATLTALRDHMREHPTRALVLLRPTFVAGDAAVVFHSTPGAAWLTPAGGRWTLAVHGATAAVRCHRAEIIADVAFATFVASHAAARRGVDVDVNVAEAAVWRVAENAARGIPADAAVAPTTLAALEDPSDAAEAVVDAHARLAANLAVTPPTPDDAPAVWRATHRPHGGLGGRGADADPATMVGPACKRCPFNGPDFCRPKEEGSIESLPRLSAKKRATLLALGVRTARDALVAHAEGKVKLTAMQIAAAGGEGDVSVNPKFVEDWVKSLSYPVVALDFEATGFALPPWSHLRPYDQLPFQFSMRSYRKSLMDDEPVRYDFLHFGDGYDPAVDPRHSLGAALFDALSTEKAAASSTSVTIIAHNSSFEERVMKSMTDRIAQQFGECRYLDTLDFSRNSIRHVGLKGSYSLKVLVKTLIDPLAYAEMSNGALAGDFFRMWHATRGRGGCPRQWVGNIPNKELDDALRKGNWDYVRKCLLNYCSLDASGMVDVVRCIHRVASSCKTSVDGDWTPISQSSTRHS